MDIVTLRTYSDPVAVALAKAYLEDAGIPCFLADQMAAAMPAVFGAAIGIRLQVMEKDAEEAHRLLNHLDEELAESVIVEDGLSGDDEEAAMAKSPEITGQTAPTVDAQCPRCRSTRIEKEYLPTFGRLLITLLLLGLPLLFLTPRRTCRTCGHTF